VDRLWFVAILEHGLMLVKIAVESMISPEPDEAYVRVCVVNVCSNVVRNMYKIAVEGMISPEPDEAYVRVCV
jgi:hypothetical protein